MLQNTENNESQWSHLHPKHSSWKENNVNIEAKMILNVWIYVKLTKDKTIEKLRKYYRKEIQIFKETKLALLGDFAFNYAEKVWEN